MEMSRATTIEQLKAIAEGFEREYDACPIAIYEAIRYLEEDEEKKA